MYCNGCKHYNTRNRNFSPFLGGGGGMREQFIRNHFPGHDFYFLFLTNHHISKKALICAPWYVYHHFSGVELRFPNDFQGEFCR